MGTARLYLALCVVLGHCGVTGYFIASEFAVHLFFVISGFCMALVLNRKYDDATTFYVARIMRLWPTYAVVVAIAALLGRTMQAPDSGLLTQIYFWFSASTLLGFDTLWWFSSKDMSFLTSLPPFTQHLARLTNMQHMWSVGIELTFYVVAPLVARRKKLVFALVPIALLISLSLSSNLEKTNPIVVRSAVSFFWLFATGMAAYWIYAGAPAFVRKIRNRAWLGVGVGLVSSIGAIVLYHPHLPLPAQPIREVIAVFMFAAGMIVAFASANASSLDRKIGDLSYPIYVVHWPLLPLYMRGVNGQIVPAIAVVCVSLIAAYLLNVCVEKQIDRFRARLVRNDRLNRPVSEDNLQVAIGAVDVKAGAAQNR